MNLEDLITTLKKIEHNQRGKEGHSNVYVRCYDESELFTIRSMSEDEDGDVIIQLGM